MTAPCLCAAAVHGRSWNCGDRLPCAYLYMCVDASSDLNQGIFLLNHSVEIIFTSTLHCHFYVDLLFMIAFSNRSCNGEDQATSWRHRHQQFHARYDTKEKKCVRNYIKIFFATIPTLLVRVLMRHKDRIPSLTTSLLSFLRFRCAMCSTGANSPTCTRKSHTFTAGRCYLQNSGSSVWRRCHECMDDQSAP